LLVKANPSCRRENVVVGSISNPGALGSLSPPDPSAPHRSGAMQGHPDPMPSTGLVRAAEAGEARRCPPRGRRMAPPRCGLAQPLPRASERCPGLRRRRQGPGGRVGPPGPPHAPHEPEELRRQLDVRLEERVGVPLTLRETSWGTLVPDAPGATSASHVMGDAFTSVTLRPGPDGVIGNPRETGATGESQDERDSRHSPVPA